MRSPIRLVDNKDGTHTLFYFDTTVGHIAGVRYLKTRERAWRAVSHVTGRIHYATSKMAARRLLLEEYA
jgi:hypothetical protein